MRGGRQGLAQHLPAEHIAEAQVLALAAKDILLDLFKLQEPQQLRQHISLNACIHKIPSFSLI